MMDGYRRRLFRDEISLLLLLLRVVIYCTSPAERQCAIEMIETRAGVFGLDVRGHSARRGTSFECGPGSCINMSIQ